MNSSRVRGWLAAMPVLFTLGCAAERDLDDLFAPNDVNLLVIDALLYVDQPMPAIYVRQTLSPSDAYDDEAAGVTGATVRIRTGDTVFEFEPDTTSAGKYWPLRRDIVLPLTTYDLTVEAPDGRRASARTTTPNHFHVDEWVLLDENTLETKRHLRTYEQLGDSVYSAPENQLTYLTDIPEIRFQRNGVPSYQIGLLNLETDSPLVIDADFLTEEQLAKLERHNASPAFEALDGTLRLPWFAVFFEGRYQMRISAIDTNWFDLLRSVPEFSGGGGFGGNAGDNFERPLFHVDGGIGLFGSAAVDTIGFTVLPRVGP